MPSGPQPVSAPSSASTLADEIHQALTNAMTSVCQNMRMDGRHHAEIDIHQWLVDSTDGDREIPDDGSKTIPGCIDFGTRSVFIPTW
jgi:hypothetical protein